MNRPGRIVTKSDLPARYEAEMVRCIVDEEYNHPVFSKAECFDRLERNDCLPVVDHDHPSGTAWIIHVETRRTPSGRTEICRMNSIVDRHGDECPECGYDHVLESWSKNLAGDVGERVKCRACDTVLMEYDGY